jgi:Asp-tRNA(Asn)/Glu-tRNA(Gln) amidotransferase A subunit family amidase
MERELEFIVGLYGRIQIELIEADILDKSGIPLGKQKELIYQDALAIYESLGHRVKRLSAEQINKMAEYTNDVAKKLINEDTLINNYLLALILYSSYLTEFGNRSEQITILPKVHRNITAHQELASDDYKGVFKTTNRVADNMWRVFNNRLQLSDELRDKRANKFLKDKKCTTK